MSWYSIAFDDTARTAFVSLTDDLGCGGKTSGDLGAELHALDPSRIELHVDSCGGDSITGMNLCEVFRRYDTHATIQLCYSAAVFAVMGAKTIHALPSARIMIHQPSAYVCGIASEVFDVACHLETLSRVVHELLCERTEQPAAVVEKWLSRDTWFTAEEALAAGLVDKIVSKPAKQSRPPTRKNSVLPTPPTMPESERLFRAWLAAFGELEVADKERFSAELRDWLNCHVREPLLPKRAICRLAEHL